MARSPRLWYRKWPLREVSAGSSRRLINAFARRGLAQSGRRGLTRILVTGAAGFIGRALCRGLAERGHTVLGRTRRPAASLPGIELRPIGDIGPQTDWSGQLEGVDCVIHLANRAHHPVRQTAGTDEAEAAAALARAAASAGVQRLVHFSSIRAMGDRTAPGAPLLATAPPQPRDPYGSGKLATERALRAVARQTGIELVILRPPLVYGPGVKGNFRWLLRLAGSGLPLPFAGVDNRRSLIFIDNLVDLAACASVHSEATGRVLLARDTADRSTPELLRALAAGLDRPLRLFAVPQAAFAVLPRIPGIGGLAGRLTLSLQVDDAETRAALGWLPPVCSEVGLITTARAFREKS
jgi:UDP-N-acetyl-alpha-D-quinovosamine dehydrogenase